MKKTLLLFICFVMLLSFCACCISEKTSEAEQIQLNAETNPASQTNENRTDSGFAWNEVFISDDGLIEITVHDDSADAIPTMCVQERYWDMVFSTIDNTKKCEINIAVMY